MFKLTVYLEGGFDEPAVIGKDFLDIGVFKQNRGQTACNDRHLVGDFLNQFMNFIGIPCFFKAFFLQFLGQRFGQQFDSCDILAKPVMNFAAHIHAFFIRKLENGTVLLVLFRHVPQNSQVQSRDDVRHGFVFDQPGFSCFGY